MSALMADRPRIRDVPEKSGGVVVGLVNLDPAEAAAVPVRPLPQYRRLPVAGRRDEQNQRRVVSRGGEPP